MALVAVLALNAANAAADVPTFQPGKGVSVYYPFMDVVRAKKNGPPSPPYYGSWSEMRARKVPAQLKEAGFELVRLPVSPVPLLAMGNEQDRQIAYSQFGAAISDILEADLNVVFDLHVTDANSPWDYKTVTADFNGPRFRAYVSLVTSVAQFLSQYDARRVAFEPFNEPPGPCVWSDRPDWSAFQKELLAAIRAAAPKLTVVLTGACWGSLEGLQALRASDYDANTIYTFHYYEPFVFTHQGAWFSSSFVRYLSRVPYPPITDRTEEFLTIVKQRAAADHTLNEAASAEVISEAKKYLGYYFGERQGRNFISAALSHFGRHVAEKEDRSFIQRRVSLAMEWAKTNGIAPQRIWVGEFGALGDVYGYRAAAAEDRQRWLTDARSVFEEFGFGWAVWNYCCAMGIIKGETSGPLDPGIIRALGLKPFNSK